MSAGTIGGVVVGGLIGLALIVAAFFLVYRHMQNKHERIVEATQRTFLFSVPQNKVKYLYPTSPSSPPASGYSPPPNPQSATYDTRMLDQPPAI